MWVVGIDEAGYGPNLGPLVQAAVALYLPDDDPAGWETLKPVVRRCHEKADERLLIDDSKKVYTSDGFLALERGVWCANGLEFSRVDHFFSTHAPQCVEELAREGWYSSEDPIPCEVWEKQDARLPGVTSRASVVPATRFNHIVDDSQSKGTVLALGLIDLIHATLQVLPASIEPLVIHCDKHGGRNFYAAMVQAAFPDGWVVAEKESALESRYRVEMLDRPVTITFKPRADAESVAVALASMTAKYLREVCMRQFNRFWAKHVPGIEPTAGYPNDAKRFYDLIKPAMKKLGLTADQVWRKK